VEDGLVVVFRYLPVFLQQKSLRYQKNKTSTEFAKYDNEGKYSQYYSGYSMVQFPVEKNQFTSDHTMSLWFEKEGVDVHELRRKYQLTPPSVEAVYKDFYKYLMDYSKKFNYDLFEKATVWQYWSFCDAFGGKTRMKSLSVDEVLPFIDRQKSATTFLNKHYKNKGQCIDSEDFQQSFCVFLYLYVMDEEVWVPCSAVRKEEIRLTEKILELSHRSFILMSLYYIILGHMLHLDFDLTHAKHWEKTRTGMGMSLFFGQYETKMKPYFNPQFKFFDFRDVSKWDSRNQEWYTEKLNAMYNLFYPERFIQLSVMLGTWWKHCDILNIPDIKVDTYKLRAALSIDEARGPVVMPRGEVMMKDRGTNSGSNRTTPKNVDVHENFNMQGGIQVFGSYSRKSYDKFRKRYQWDHLGDDVINAGPDGKPSDATVQIMKESGWEIDRQIVSSPWELEYMSCKPLQVEQKHFGTRIVPMVNSSKVIASLIDKMKAHETKEEKLMRLTSALLLCAWTEDAECILHVRERLLTLYPDLRHHRLNKSLEELRSMYFGELEGVSNDPLFMCFLEDHVETFRCLKYA